MNSTEEILNEPTTEIVSKKKPLKSYLRFLIGFGLLTIAYLSVDTKKLINSVSLLSTRELLVLCFGYILGQLLSALKWRLLLRNIGIERGILECLKAYFFGMFVNSFSGFGTIGGDLARGLSIFPEKGKKIASISTVVVDRIHGLIILLIIAGFSGMIFRPSEISNLFWVGPLIVVAISLIVWSIGIPYFLSFFPESKFKEKLTLAFEAFPRSYETLAKISILSFSMHITQIFLHYHILKVLGVTLPIGLILVVVPVVNTISSLPISFMNGLGVRDSAYILILGHLIGNDKCLALGGFWFIAITVSSLLGAFSFGADARARLKEV